MRPPLMRPFAAVLAIAWMLTLAACGGDPEPAMDDIPPARVPAYDATRFDRVADPAWAAYLGLQDALAYDRFDEAHAAAQRLRPVAGELAAEAEAAAAAPDIEALRTAFEPLSEGMIARSDRPQGFVVAYCPMAFDYDGGRWVQSAGPLMNPYFGDRMLHCGAFEEPAGVP
jgi:hypothetical protein